MNRNNSEKNSNLFQNKSMIVTSVLLIAITLISFLLVWRINYLAREQCYSILSSSTKETYVKIENNFTSDRNSLRILSRVIAQDDDLTSREVNDFLTAYNVSSLISDIAILTPENMIIQIRGGNIQDNTILDYQTEVSKGEHVSGLSPSFASSDQQVMRSFVPIKQSGKIIGLLYLSMNPSEIAKAWAPEIYDNAAAFCVIDRSNGEFIINSWDDSIHNLSDLSSDELAENIRNGETGYMQMKTSSGKDDIFVSYMPMEMENWEIIVTVPESAVFASSNAIKHSLQFFIIGMSLLLVSYLVWIVYTNRRTIAKTEKEANIDVLTGLQNRNLYEAFCRTLDEDKLKGLSCIYIDANGLHEVNNTRGHLAGDQMLRFIADALKVAFGEDLVYRIGGDEFVVFQRNRIEKELNSDLQKVHTEIERNDYHMSSGICMAASELSIEEMIKTAEQRMYEAKRKYYESIGQQVRNNLND